ncbi:MAG: VPLPA-CTERM sorting domain-containing protein [Gammaproteobacteria bacterium]|nr:VPLPA-CTERM sorting domain-containing protein [Gammaproteobacteria bacterium]
MSSFRIATTGAALALGAMLATGAQAAVTSYELTGTFSSPGTLDANFDGSVGQPFAYPTWFSLIFEVDDSVSGSSDIFFPATNFAGAASNLSLLVDGNPFPMIFWTSASADVRQVYADAPWPQRWTWSSSEGTFSSSLTATGTSTGEPLELFGTGVDIDLVDPEGEIYATELASTSLITLDPARFNYGEISIFWSGQNDAEDFADFSVTGNIETISVITAVPAPAGIWLLGTALLGLAGAARRRHA